MVLVAAGSLLRGIVIYAQLSIALTILRFPNIRFPQTIHMVFIFMTGIVSMMMALEGQSDAAVWIAGAILCFANVYFVVYRRIYRLWFAPL